MASPEAMTATVHAYVEAFARDDAAMAADLLAENPSVEDPVGTPQRRGKAKIAEFYRAGMTTGEKLTLDEPVRVAAGHAAFGFHVDLGWEGENRRIDVIDLIRFVGAGKIAEMRAFFDPANVGKA